MIHLPAHPFSQPSPRRVVCSQDHRLPVSPVPDHAALPALLKYQPLHCPSQSHSYILDYVVHQSTPIRARQPSHVQRQTTTHLHPDAIHLFPPSAPLISMLRCVLTESGCAAVGRRKLCKGDRGPRLPHLADKGAVHSTCGGALRQHPAEAFWKVARRKREIDAEQVI